MNFNTGMHKADVGDCRPLTGVPRALVTIFSRKYNASTSSLISTFDSLSLVARVAYLISANHYYARVDPNSGLTTVEPSPP